MNSFQLTELAGLVLLGSWSLALPAALLTVITLVLAFRKRPLRKRAATLIASAFSALVGSAVMIVLWAIKGGYEDAVLLAVLIPGAAIIAALGAVPAALLARWLLKINRESREETAGFEVA